MNKNMYLTILVILSLTTACSTPIINNQKVNIISDTNLKINTTVSGKVDFSNFSSIESKITPGRHFGIKSLLADVSPNATVSIIYPSDNISNPNVTVATGLTDSNGNFSVRPDSSFIPKQGEIFILEASKRFHGNSNSLMSIRTYIQRVGNDWKSMTKPGIAINVQTTALSAMAGLMSSAVSSSDTIGTIDMSGGNIVPSDIKHSGIPVIHAESILKVADFVSYALSKNNDPLQYIVYKNGIFLMKDSDSITNLITTVAGSGIDQSFWRADNYKATNTQLRSPMSANMDKNGNLYIIDQSTIRKINALTGIISTVAGTVSAGIPLFGYNGDNIPATSALLDSPSGITFDASGNLYIADTNNHRIRKVDKITGIITTVAGNGSKGYDWYSMSATSAQLNFPKGITFDSSGNLYIADSNNYRIRKVNTSTGVISTVAGYGIQGYNGDNIPATSAQLNSPTGITIDSSGNLYITDQNNYRIRKINTSTGFITTVAGNGIQGYNGDNLSATLAQLNYPSGITVDSSGNIYFTDTANNRIRKVNTSTGIISTVAGNGIQGNNWDNLSATLAQLNYPLGITIDTSENLYITDTKNYRVGKVNNSTGIITTFAGGGVGDNESATAAQLSPFGIKLDTTGNLYVADSNNNRIRKFDVTTGVITTVVGNGFQGYNGDSITATFAQLSNPSRLTFDSSGNMYIADTGNNRIRKVDKTTGIISTVAGNSIQGYNGDNIPATSAQLNDPKGIAIDSSGNLYISDSGNLRIRKVDKNTGIITTFAGNGSSGYNGDNISAISAYLYNPSALMIDSSGNLYISDTGNNRIRKVNTSTGVITSVAGGSTQGFSGDNGSATSASLNTPNDIAFDTSGNMYIADAGNNRIRKVDTSTDIITTFAGNGTPRYGGDNDTLIFSILHFPSGITFDSSGNLYIADTGNNRIRKVVFNPTTAP